MNDVPPLDAQRNAHLLGSLVGVIEGGFHIAVNELNQRNEAVEKMVDVLFRVGGLLPDVKLPGVAGLLKDLTVDEIKKWVTDSLKEKPKDAAEALPFHALFIGNITNPDLADHYISARSDAFTNRGVGLVH